MFSFPSEGYNQHSERDLLVVCFGEPEEVSPEEEEGKEEEGGGEGRGGEGGGIKFKKDE